MIKTTPEKKPHRRPTVIQVFHVGEVGRAVKMALRTRFGFAAVNHLYTEEEKQILHGYQSLEYLPPHSKVYRNWLQQQPARLDWDRWLMMGLIGFSVGILGFLLHQIIDLISEVKWESTKAYITEGDFSTALMWTFSYSVIFLIVSTVLVVYQPAAAGSGIPEIIGFLNGTRIPDIFKVCTLYMCMYVRHVHSIHILGLGYILQGISH